MKGSLWRLACVLMLVICCLGSVSFAQPVPAYPHSSGSVLNAISVSNVSTARLMGTVVLQVRSNSNKICKPYERDCKKRVSASEGGRTSMYVFLAGLACLGAIVFRFRKQRLLGRSA